MDTIRCVDTTIRDGHQSLWAENMTTGMMLPIAEKLDNAGFEGIELISGSHLKKNRARAEGRSLGARPAHVQAYYQDAAPPHCRPSQHIRIQSAGDVPALRRAHVRQRHPRGAHFG